MNMLIDHYRFGGGAPVGITPPTETYEYDFATRPWSQATSPTALYDANSDKTYYAWEALAQFRHIKVAAYDHSTETWSDPTVIDVIYFDDNDHPVASLEILSDGRLVAFYGSHNSDQYWAISDQSGGEPDITTWTRQTEISGEYTYPKPVNIDSAGGAGTLYLFMRLREGGTNSRYILRTASYTSGGALTFSAEDDLIDFDGGADARVYASDVRPDGSGDIEFCATRADSGDTTRQDVYYFRYIVATGNLENLSGGVSTAGEINLTTANASYREKTSSGSNITGWVSWCRDTNDNLHIAYGDDTTDPWGIAHDWHDGSSWQGESVAFTVDRKGTGGFVEQWSLVPETSGNVAAYYAGGGGSFTGRGNDDLLRKRWTGSWGAEQTVLEGDGVTALGNAHAVRDAHADMRVIFSEVTQDSLIGSRFRNKRYFFGDGGFIEWPEPSDPEVWNNNLTLNFQGADGATSTEDESQWRDLHPVTFNGNAQLDTGVTPPWGSSWLLLDGAGDYLTIPRARTDLNISGGDWKFEGGDSLEVVFRLNELGRTQTLAATRQFDGVNQGWTLVVNSSNVLRFLGWDSGGSIVTNMTSTTVFTTGTVYVASVKRSASGWSMRVDGTEEDTGVAANPHPGDDTLYIGRQQTTTANDFNGWIKQVRFTKLADRDLSVVPAADFPT